MSLVSRWTVRKSVNGKAAEVPPPGLPLVTVISTESSLLVRVASTAVASCVLSRKLVARGFPFQLMVDPATKFAPFTVSVKAPPVTCVLCGDIEDRMGVRLYWGPVTLVLALALLFENFGSGSEEL